MDDYSEDDIWCVSKKSKRAKKKKKGRKRTQSRPVVVFDEAPEQGGKSLQWSTARNAQNYGSISQIGKKTDNCGLLDTSRDCPPASPKEDSGVRKSPNPSSSLSWGFGPKASPSSRGKSVVQEPESPGSEIVEESFSRTAKWRSKQAPESIISNGSDVEDFESYGSFSVPGSGGMGPWRAPKYQYADSDGSSSTHSALPSALPSSTKPWYRRWRTGPAPYRRPNPRPRYYTHYARYSDSDDSAESYWQRNRNLSDRIQLVIRRMFNVKTTDKYYQVRFTMSCPRPSWFCCGGSRRFSDTSSAFYTCSNPSSVAGSVSRPSWANNRSHEATFSNEELDHSSDADSTLQQTPFRDTSVGQTGNFEPVQNAADVPLDPPLFEYQQLETPRTIRLLKLISEGPGRFQFVMSHHSLDKCPPFEAISYTWTDPTYRSPSLKSPSVREIDCNGRKCEIPANLFNALPAIARVQKTAYLWADAVCIHQKDDDEKGIQVLLMGDIYSQASRVIIWLGEDNSVEVPDFAGFHGKFDKARAKFEQKRGVGSLRSQDPRDQSFIQEFWAGGVEDWESKWVLYFSFFQFRRWFRRVWIIQEVALAKDLVMLCGDKVIPWKEMTALGTFLRKNAWRHSLAGLVQSSHLLGIGDEADNLIEYQRQVLAGPTIDNRLLALFQNVDGAVSPRERWFAYLQYLVQEGRRFQASVELDHIYGFIGLCQRFLPPDMDSPFQPNYKTTPEEMYTQITLRLLQELPRLSTMSFAVCSVNPQAAGNIPSWVPDYAKPLGLAPLIHIGDGKVFDACKGQPKSNIEHVDQCNGLALNGMSIAKVASVLPADWDGTSIYSNACYAIKWLQACQQLQPRHIPSEQSKIEVLWRTLMVDTTERSPRIHPAPENYGIHFRQWMTEVLVQGVMTATPRRRGRRLGNLLSNIDKLCEEHGALLCLPTRQDVEACFVRLYLSNDSTFSKQATKSDGREGVFLFQSAFKEVSPKRSLFITSDGRLGLGPAYIKPGDEVWLVPGSRVPIVLQKTNCAAVSKSLRHTYRLVGECYVHGIMHGEAWIENIAAMDKLILV